MDNILVTGSAGFIGSALSLRLLEEGFKVIGIDNHNDYYDPLLKEERLSRHLNHDNYHHYRIDIKDVEELQKVFEKYKFKFVINLAAQAGVRYSIENPTAYINTNILGFYNILELSKNFQTEHLFMHQVVLSTELTKNTFFNKPQYRSSSKPLWRQKN